MASPFGAAHRRPIDTVIICSTQFHYHQFHVSTTANPFTVRQLASDVTLREKNSAITAKPELQFRVGT
jgi:hypothetical protein